MTVENAETRLIKAQNKVLKAMVSAEKAKKEYRECLGIDVSTMEIKEIEAFMTETSEKKRIFETAAETVRELTAEAQACYDEYEKDLKSEDLD